MPVREVVINIGINRTGSVFRPAYDWGVEFDGGLPERVGEMTVNGAGDRRLPNVMPRDTVYRYRFLHIDHRREDVTALLHTSYRGFYSDRAFRIEPETEYAWMERGERIGDVRYTQGVRDYSERQIVVQPYGANPAAVGAPPFALRTDPLAMLRDFEQRIFNAPQTDNGMVRWAEHFTAAIPFTDILMDVRMRPWLVHYADYVYENYTALPDTLPDRVRELAHELTDGAESDYGRILMLRAHLTEFPYTLTPPPIPAGWDFVDHFLFEGRTGYCVYYATAMAVLARCVGIPSRYVEGFVLPPRVDIHSAWRTVTNRHAHAWVEVYLEGFGWVPVEATAPYAYAADHNLMDDPDLSEDAEPRERRNPNATGETDWERLLISNPDLYYAMFPEELEAIESMLTHTAETPTGGGGNERFPWVRGVAGAVFLAILYVISLRVVRLIKRIYIGRLGTNRQSMAYFKALLRLTAYCRYPMEADETLLMYGNRLRKRFAFKNETVYLYDLIDIYHRAVYSAHPVQAQEAALMKGSYDEMVKQIRRETSWPVFWYIRYIRKVVTL
jgi:transglutaminase-like putative cysteine protease